MNKLDDATVLIIVDAQYGFMPGGGLAVADGDAVVPVVNRIAPRFANVVLTQDWHPADHISFAANHPGRAPFETITLPYGEQVLWPTHCVQGTRDAALHDDLRVPQAQLIIRKGFHRDVDSYSAFMEADRRTSTGRVPEGARHHKAVSVRAGDRLLRGLERAGCARGRLRSHSDRGCVPCHRPERLAGQGLGRHGGGWRGARSVHGYLSQTRLQRLMGKREQLSNQY